MQSKAWQSIPTFSDVPEQKVISKKDIDEKKKLQLGDSVHLKQNTKESGEIVTIHENDKYTIDFNSSWVLKRIKSKYNTDVDQDSYNFIRHIVSSEGIIYKWIENGEIYISET